MRYALSSHFDAPRRAPQARTACARCLVLALSAVAMSAAAVDIAPPKINESVDYRDVGGATEDELVASLKSVATADEKGHRFAGDTHWQLRWDFRVESSGDDCRVASVATEVDIHTTLIRWNPPLNAKHSLVKRWNTFADALRRHEDGHRDIAVAAAHEVSDRVGKVPPASDCKKLKQTLEQTADAVMREYREKENSYDVTTMHGRAQGATFP